MLDAALCCADDITAQALLQLNCEVTKFVFEIIHQLDEGLPDLHEANADVALPPCRCWLDQFVIKRAGMLL